MQTQNENVEHIENSGLPSLPSIVSQKQKLSDQVYDILCENIVKGKLKPKQRLREAEVADALDVSRTPVREALSLMEQQHLVERDPTGAYLVADWDEQTLWEIATLRSTLEGLAVRLACKKLETADFDFLQSVIMQMKAAYLRGDFDSLIDLDIEFHRYIWQHTGHSLLYEALNSMAAQVRYFMYITRPGDEETYADSHQTLLEVLRQGDPHDAEVAIQQHTENTAQRAINRIEQD